MYVCENWKASSIIYVEILRIKNSQEHPEKNEVKGLILSNIKTYYIVTVLETMSGVGERIDSVH